MKSNIADRYNDPKWDVKNYKGSLNQTYSKTPSRKRKITSKSNRTNNMNKSWTGRGATDSNPTGNRKYAQAKKLQKSPLARSGQNLLNEMQAKKLASLKSRLGSTRSNISAKPGELNSEYLLAFEQIVSTNRGKSKSPKPTRKKNTKNTKNSTLEKSESSILNGENLFPTRDLPYLPTMLSIPTVPKEYNILQDLFIIDSDNPIIKRYFYSICKGRTKNTDRNCLVKIYNKKRIQKSPDFLESVKKEIMLHIVLGGNSSGIIDVTKQLSEEVQNLNESITEEAQSSKSVNE